MGWVEARKNTRGTSYRASVVVPGQTAPLRRTLPTKTAAREWIRNTESDLARGTFRDPDAGAVTFAAWVKVWLATRGTLEPASQREEEGICTNHLIPAFGTRRLDDIGPVAIETLISGLVGRRAPKTIRNVHGVLHNIMGLAVREGLLAANPCIGTRLPKGKRIRPRAFLSEQQVSHLIATVDPYWQPLVRLLVGTGLRWSEAVGLKVRYVDLLGTTPQLRVQETVDEDRGGVFTWKSYAKSDAGERTLGLGQDVVDVLAELTAGKAGDDLVFTEPNGLPIRHAAFNRRWVKWCKTAGLSDPKPTIHDLRHTHAALLIARGVPLSAIKVRLGHESIDTTDRLYGYLLKRVEDDILKALDEALPVQDRTENSLRTPLESPEGASHPL